MAICFSTYDLLDTDFRVSDFLHILCLAGQMNGQDEGWESECERARYIEELPTHIQDLASRKEMPLSMLVDKVAGYGVISEPKVALYALIREVSPACWSHYMAWILTEIESFVSNNTLLDDISSARQLLQEEAPYNRDRLIDIAFRATSRKEAGSGEDAAWCLRNACLKHSTALSFAHPIIGEQFIGMAERKLKDLLDTLN